MSAKRTVAGDTQTEIVKQSVAPFFLVQIAFASTGTAYISSGPTVTYGGNVYSGGYIEVSDIKWDVQGAQGAKLYLPDYNGSALAFALGNVIVDTECWVYFCYGDASAHTTPELLIHGYVNPGRMDAMGIELNVASIKADDEFYPQEYCTAENGFSFLPEDGKVIEWAGEKYELVRSD